MDAFRTWAFSLCVAMIVCGICRMILPKSNLQKIFSITVSAFFLCCLLSPAVFGYSSVRILAEEYTAPEIERRAQALTDAAYSQAERAAWMQLEKIIREMLWEMGINGGDAAINIITNGQHGPERVDIVLDARHEDSHERIREKLTGAIGIDVRLGYTDMSAEDGE